MRLLAALLIEYDMDKFNNTIEELSIPHLINIYKIMVRYINLLTLEEYTNLYCEDKILNIERILYENGIP